MIVFDTGTAAMQRILVIGSPGAGKTTFARKLAARSDLPLHHLDRIFWLPGWVERDRREVQDRLEDILVTDRWIIDGNYGSSLPQRIARADGIIWLDYPTHLSLTRVLHRWWRYRGKTRPDMTEACPERLDAAFLLYVLNFRRAWHRRNAAVLARLDGERVRFSTPVEAERWLARADFSG
jgi:adenylate kinase family enzyme